MKRVKVMLSAILVMAIVAGALAFKVKSADICAYTKTIEDNPPATTNCDRIHLSTTVTTRQVVAGAATQYATTVAKVDDDPVPCPTATAQCSKSKTLSGE